MADIKFIETRSELGAGTRGASLGIDALKIAALDYRSNIFKKYGSVIVADENNYLFEPIRSRNAKRLEKVVGICNRVADAVQTIVKAKHFPIVLSGDHSNALGTMAGLKQAYQGARIGVIWVDAHSDLHTPFTTPSGNVHGMPLAAAIGDDNSECQANAPSKAVVESWEKLKGLAGDIPIIDPRDIVFVSLRDFESQESALIKKHKMKVIPTKEIREMGTDRTCRTIFNYLSHCHYLYISFDVDCLDPSVSSGTGTPVPGGLTEKEAANIILELIQNQKVACFEVTEINPTLDKENLMAENAFELLQKVVNQLEID